VKIRPNRVKQQLAAGKVATIVAGTNEPDLIDQLGTLGVDGIWLEGEHGGVDYADLGNLTRACDLWGVTSVVRVMDNDYATIYRTLDRGAMGIVVPHVNTRAEAQSAVESAKFAPLGKRGMFTSRQGFGVGDYLKTANDQSLLIVLIEDIVAVRALDTLSRHEARLRKLHMNTIMELSTLLQMRRKLSEARHAAGQPDVGDFLPMIEKVASEMKDLPVGPVRIVSYEGGRMTLEVMALDGPSIDRIVTRLRQTGLNAESSSSTTGAGRANTVITVRVS
jgi:hypothetical protein